VLTTASPNDLPTNPDDEKPRRPPPGARFYDSRRREMGFASGVTRRPRGLTPLTVIDVAGAGPALFAFLTHLDKSHLSLRDGDTGALLYEFRWASGYADGTAVRIHGVLDAR
jgi:hypothetical protein